jgi:DNA-binding response OmpR family regulator
VPFSILVVEDNQMVGAIVQSTLERRGHKTVLANSGQQAADWLSKNRCQLVLLNAMVSGSASQLKEVLRKQRQETGVPVLGYSAFASGGVDVHKAAALFDGYIANARDPEKLISTVEDYLLASAASFLS